MKRVKKLFAVVLTVILLAVCTVPLFASAQTFPSDTCQHEWVWVVDTPANALTVGRKHQVCTKCGAVQNMNTSIPANFRNRGLDNVWLEAIDGVSNAVIHLYEQIKEWFAQFR